MRWSILGAPYEVVHVGDSPYYVVQWSIFEVDYMRSPYEVVHLRSPYHRTEVPIESRMAGVC